MKKILIIFLTVFSLISSNLFAKEADIKSISEPKLNESLTKLDKSNSIKNNEIEQFDFQKIFSEAEGYFKAAKAWNKLKCEPKTGFLCTKKECLKRDIKAVLILDKKKKTITRCETENCETFAAEFKQTGVFYNIQSEGPIGTLIRVLGDSRYKEITTVGLDAYIANGNCEAVNEE